MSEIDRRRLIRGLAAATAAGGAALVSSEARGDAQLRKLEKPLSEVPPLQVPPLEVPPWTREQGRRTGVPYGTPSEYEEGVRRRLPGPPLGIYPTTGSSNSFTPLQDMQSMITPNGLHYERHHAGVPTIDPREHRLVVHGMVERDLLFTMEDLMRFPSASRVHFLECSGNSDSEWTKQTGRTPQEAHGLVSCSYWTGVSLRTVLAEAGVHPEAKWILAEGADGACMTRSVPLSIAVDDCLLAYGQNGERLRPEQGYPLRLLAPGCEGNLNIKWLRRLEVGKEPFQTNEETRYYTDPISNADGPTPNGLARQFTFVMEAKSVIISPAGGQQLPGKGQYEIRGLSWSGRGKIRQVDVSVDGGRNWASAKLDAPVLPKAITYFRKPWRWDGKPCVLLSRAQDETGYVQPFRQQLLDVRGENSEYHNNAIQAWYVHGDGKVDHGA